MPLALAIVTPERPVVEAPVDTVVAPGAEGEFGVLPAHEPYLATLRPGVVRFRPAGDSGEERVAVASGFAEVTGERVTLLVQAAELAHEIDRDRAVAARDRAEEALRRLGHAAPPDEFAAARDALARAQARLEAISP